MQGVKLVFYHCKLFHGAVMNYLTYDKDHYALV
jgi:hypothetical protein